MESQSDAVNSESGKQKWVLQYSQKFVTLMTEGGKKISKHKISIPLFKTQKVTFNTWATLFIMATIAIPLVGMLFSIIMMICFLIMMAYVLVGIDYLSRKLFKKGFVTYTSYVSNEG